MDPTTMQDDSDRTAHDDVTPGVEPGKTAEQSGDSASEQMESASKQTGAVAPAQAPRTDGGEDVDEDLWSLFDELPWIDEPTDMERYAAKLKYPSDIVPDEGPVPDPHHGHRVTCTIRVPEWVVASLAHRFREMDEPPVVDRVHDFALEYVAMHTEFVADETDEPLADVVKRRVRGDAEE